MNNLNTLTIFTKALLDIGLDLDVTLNGSYVGVELFESTTGRVVGSSVKGSLEESLADILAIKASLL